MTSGPQRRNMERLAVWEFWEKDLSLCTMPLTISIQFFQLNNMVSLLMMTTSRLIHLWFMLKDIKKSTSDSFSFL